MEAREVATGAKGDVMSLGGRRILTVADVMSAFGLEHRAASDLMSATDAVFRVGKNKLVWEDDLLRLVAELQEAERARRAGSRVEGK